MFPSLGIELVGQSHAVVRARELVRRAAPLDGGVLLVGEPGIDVTSVAREIHDRSRYGTEPWLALECQGGSAGAVEPRLFGTAPAGDADLVAVAPDSLIAAARGTSLFLQDVAELSAAIQARLARLIRDGEVRLDGRITPANIRLIASAQPSIDEDVRANRFRQDLYRRLAVSRVDLPPLRDRAADVPALADRILQETCSGTAHAPRSFTRAAHALLAAFSWPHNLAELRAAVAKVVSTTDASVLQIEHLLTVLQIDRALPGFAPSGTLRDARLRFEREYISAVLQHHGWQLGEAARTLGIQRPNLYRKARQLGIPLARQTA